MKTRIALSVLMLSSLVSTPGFASGGETTSPGAAADAAVAAVRYREAASSVDGSTEQAHGHRHEPLPASAHRYPLSEVHDHIVVHADSAAGLDDAAWAIGRFEMARLALPAIEIWMSNERSECKGSAAYLADQPDGSLVIRNCATRFTLLHELGHAWDIGFLTDTRRASFMRLRGLETWNSDDWASAAGEHAATVLAWGLNDGRINLHQLQPADPTSMRHAYLSLVGRRPLWEEQLTSVHGPLHDVERRVAARAPVTAAPTALEAKPGTQSRPEVASRLEIPVEKVRTLRKPDLRAVADDRGRVGFLQAEAALAFRAMRIDAAQDGVSLRFTSAWRSWPSQNRAYQHFLVTGLNLAGNPVPNIANPDHSNHPRGLAIDLAMREGVAEWLEAHAADHGWYSISSETWHWEYRGAEAYLAELTELAPPPFPPDRYQHEGFQSWL